MKGSIFVKADLTKANLYKSNFRNSNFEEAILEGAYLEGANLVNTNFTRANITGISLYGTAKDDWIIDKIKCDYFYNDPNRKIRIPKNKIFKKGEFEERYKHLPTFEYIFEKGFTPIDALIMDQVVQAINEQKPEIELKLDSFHSRGQPRAVFTVLNYTYKKDALEQVTNKYEQKIKYLEGKNEGKDEVLKELLSCIKPQQLIQGRNITIGENTMGDKGDNVSFSGNGNIAFGKNSATVKQTNIQYTANNELLSELD